MQLGERLQGLLEMVGRISEVDGKERGEMGQGLKSHLVPEDCRHFRKCKLIVCKARK